MCEKGAYVLASTGARASPINIDGEKTGGLEWLK
jgi:hypothetical protein